MKLSTLGTLESALDEIVEHRAPSLGAFAAHALTPTSIPTNSATAPGPCVRPDRD
jgi:hypothetical protein